MSWRNTLRIVDASSIVQAWDSYPIEIFPQLWDWLAGELAAGQLQIPDVAYVEVGHVCPDCAIWLKNNAVQVASTDAATVATAMAIKNLMGIQNDEYHRLGVDENDVLVISAAKVHAVELLSNESVQSTLPVNIKQYKIPAVCNLVGVKVTCISFLDFLKASKVSF